MDKQLGIVVWLTNISDAFFALLDDLFEKKVITGRNVIVFIGLDAFTSVMLVDSILYLHGVKNCIIDRHWVDANLDSFELAFTFYYFEPRVLPDLVDGVPLLGVCVEDAVEEVLGVVRHPLRRLEVGTQDLLVQVGGVRVLKGQISTDKREEDDTTRPNIDVGSIVLLSGDHFWSSITGRTTCCL